ncbi:hypothetical protein [Wenyingzhuangia sp. IMCC45574]
MIKKGISLLLLFIASACTKQNINQQNTLVPWSPVEAFSNNLTLIKTPGDHDVLPGGYNSNGIVVYNLGNDRFFAYDLTCPHLSPSECNQGMTYDSSTGDITCTCGDTNVVFNLGNRSAKGKDGNTYHLREYRVIVQGNQLRVTNF